MAHGTMPMLKLVVSFQAVAIACTVTRLLYRWYTRRFWWEDVWAVIATVLAVVCVTGYLLYDTCMSLHSVRNQTSAWLLAISFTGVLWAVRISIFLSLVRISNPTGSLRRIVLACIASFLIMFLASIAQKIYYCAAHQCSISVNIGIMQLTTDILADGLLLLGPIPLLRDVHLSKNRRTLVLCGYWSSIFITIISIAHSVLLLDEANVLTTILAALKTALSLFICNVLVLVTFLYRVCRRQGKRASGGNLDRTLPETGPLDLTTIDLALLTGGSVTATATTTATTTVTITAATVTATTTTTTTVRTVGGGESSVYASAFEFPTAPAPGEDEVQSPSQRSSVNASLNAESGDNDSGNDDDNVNDSHGHDHNENNDDDGGGDSDGAERVRTRQSDGCEC